MYPTVWVPDSPSRKTQFLTPLAFRGPRSDQSTDPGITGPRGGGSPQETTLAEQRGDAGRRDPGLRPREEPESPSPRGDRREPERGSRGEGAAGPGLATNTSQVHHSLCAAIIRFSVCLLGDWELLACDLPSRAKFSPTQPQEEDEEEWELQWQHRVPRRPRPSQEADLAGFTSLAWQWM